MHVCMSVVLCAMARVGENNMRESEWLHMHARARASTIDTMRILRARTHICTAVTQAYCALACKVCPPSMLTSPSNEHESCPVQCDTEQNRSYFICATLSPPPPPIDAYIDCLQKKHDRQCHTRRASNE